MSTVQTIRGPIDSADLGRTLSHEHLTGGAAAMDRVMPPIYDLDEAVRRGVEALRRAKAAGVDSIIDLTPLDLGRQAPLFQRIAEADTGVHIVCATGVYRWVPFYLFRRDIDEVASIFLHDIEHGIDGTDIRPGIIKLAWDFEYGLTAEGPAGDGMPRAGLERTARAAARAAKAGGVPISCHTNASMRLGLPLMAIFEDEGVDPAMVTIGHSNDSHDFDYVRGIAERGFNIGLDRFGIARGEEEMARRSQIALDLARAGFAAQTSLGHDASPYYRFTSNVPENPDCWTAVSTVEVPWLLGHGATQADVDAMQITSIRRTFEAAARVKGSRGQPRPFLPW
ncbi:MAG: hypothetical protein IT299_07040 [Dehalococcoidia bacterium]|nr:hypothetical protein [Dehalococcoidia bacterium]